MQQSKVINDLQKSICHNQNPFRSSKAEADTLFVVNKVQSNTHIFRLRAVILGEKFQIGTMGSFDTVTMDMNFTLSVSIPAIPDHITDPSVSLYWVLSECVMPSSTSFGNYATVVRIYMRTIRKCQSTDFLISRLGRPETCTLHWLICVYGAQITYTLLCNLWTKVLLISHVKKRHVLI